MEVLDGKYQIEQLLGQGGMGAVYKATQDGTLKLNDDFSPKEFGFNFSMSGRSALFQLLNVFVTPLIAIMISLLYLKTRRAGGESLKDASDQFEALDIPRSKWQVRLRTRSSSAQSFDRFVDRSIGDVRRATKAHELTRTKTNSTHD